MKKTIKRVLIGFFVLIGILVVISGFFIYKFYSETKEMTPNETSKINDSVFCIKDQFVNSFLFKGENGYLMIDAGFSDKSLKIELEKLSINPEEISTILLTHTDGDHIGGMGLFKNVKTYLHKDEEQMINGTNGKFFFMRTKWEYGPYLLLNNNDTVPFENWKIKIIPTPGHSPGSSCYLINNEYLLTGDNIAYKEGKFDHFNDFFNMDTPKQEISLKNLPDLNSIKYILTSHHGIIKH